MYIVDIQDDFLLGFFWLGLKRFGTTNIELHVHWTDMQDDIVIRSTWFRKNIIIACIDRKARQSFESETTHSKSLDCFSL